MHNSTGSRKNTKQDRLRHQQQSSLNKRNSNEMQPPRQKVSLFLVLFFVGLYLVVSVSIVLNENENDVVGGLRTTMMRNDEQAYTHAMMAQSSPHFVLGEGNMKHSSSQTRVKRQLNAAPEMRMMNHDMQFDEGRGNGVSSSSSLGDQYLSQMEASLEKLEQQKSLDVQSPMLVHHGNMNVRVPVDNMSMFQKQLDMIVNETGQGYYQDQSQHNKDTNYERHYMTIRVRSLKFDQVLEEIRAIAKVTSWNVNTHDVTEQFVDATARADVLEAARTSLQSLMSKANTVEEVLLLQNELNHLTSQIESHRQRAQQLQKDSDFSTLTLEVSFFRDTIIIHSWSPLDSAVRAVHHITKVCRDMTDLVIYMMVWSFPIGLLCYCIVKVFGGCLKAAMMKMGDEGRNSIL